VVLICQIIVFLPNIAIIVIVAYLVLLIARFKKNPIHILNIISEFLGALARLIYFIDPMGSYHVITTSLNIGIFVFMFPFGLINCLLLSLYFQESMRPKEVKIFFYLRKTKWIFYAACILLLVILVFIPITRETTFYDTYRLICVIVIAIIAAAIAVFFIISGVQIIDTLNAMGISGSSGDKKRQLSARIIVTASCLFVMVILFFISRATPLRSPAGYLISITIAVTAVTAVGLFSLASLLVIITKVSPSSTRRTKATKTSSKTSGGGSIKTNIGEDLDDKDEDSSKKDGSEEDLSKKDGSEDKDEDLSKKDGSEEDE